MRGRRPSHRTTVLAGPTAPLAVSSAVGHTVNAAEGASPHVPHNASWLGFHRLSCYHPDRVIVKAASVSLGDQEGRSMSKGHSELGALLGGSPPAPPVREQEPRGSVSSGHRIPCSPTLGSRGLPVASLRGFLAWAFLSSPCSWRNAAVGIYSDFLGSRVPVLLIHFGNYPHRWPFFFFPA